MGTHKSTEQGRRDALKTLAKRIAALKHSMFATIAAKRQQSTVLENEAPLKLIPSLVNWDAKTPELSMLGANSRMRAGRKWKNSRACSLDAATWVRPAVTTPRFSLANMQSGRGSVILFEGTPLPRRHKATSLPQASARAHHGAAGEVPVVPRGHVRAFHFVWWKPRAAWWFSWKAKLECRLVF